MTNKEKYQEIITELRINTNDEDEAGVMDIIENERLGNYNKGTVICDYLNIHRTDNRIIIAKILEKE